MLDLAVEQVTALPHAIVPTLAFTLHVRSQQAIESILLHVQIRIEPTRRGYPAPARGRLADLFGPPEEWSRTVHSLLWTHAGLVVPAFHTHCRVELPVPCSFDFNLAATKYFSALDDGDVPLDFLFSGSIFRHNEQGHLQVSRISWACEASFRMPVPVWQDLMHRYFPNTTWLGLRSDVFQRLEECKRQHAFATAEQTLEYLLSSVCTEAGT